MRKDPKHKTATVLLRNVPREVKNHFRAYCIKRNKTMTGVLTQYMRKCAGMDE